MFGTRSNALEKSKITLSVWSSLSSKDDNFVDQGHQLSFTTSPGPETMLAVRENLMMVHMFPYVTGDDMFKHLAAQAGQ